VRDEPDSRNALAAMRILADLAGRVGLLEDPEALQEEVIVQAMQIFRCDSGTIWLWDGRQERLRMGPVFGRARSLRPKPLLEADAVRDVVLADRRPLVIHEPDADLGEEVARWHGLAVVPIGQGGPRPLGLLVLGDVADDRPFDAMDEAMMEAVGNVAAIALETAIAFAGFREQMSRRMTEAMAELSRASAELSRLKVFNEELFNSAPVGILVFDREFRVTFRNAAADRLWPHERLTTAAAARTSLARVDPDWEAGLRDVVLMHRPWGAEGVTVHRPSREPARVNLAASPLVSSAGDVVGGVLIVEDVTQRAEIEQRLGVSERLAGVGRLAAVVAHELNNPLDGIMRLVSLAERVGADAPDPRLAKYLAEAKKGLGRMATIVRELLDFSRSASGAVEPMPIQDLLVEAVEALRPAAEKAGVRVAIDCRDDLPRLRSGTLYQVALNLVKNAVEAVPDGGHVRVAARTDPGGLVIEVDDDGPGIPEEARPHLFEPFYTLKREGRGTGLGLVICKDLIEKQGGTIEALNRPEGGARFTVRIPLASAPADPEG